MRRCLNSADPRGAFAGLTVLETSQLLPKYLHVSIGVAEYKSEIISLHDYGVWRSQPQLSSALTIHQGLVFLNPTINPTISYNKVIWAATLLTSCQTFARKIHGKFLFVIKFRLTQ